MTDDIGRNDPCHCGSGKKYKKCCMRKDEEAARDTVSADPGATLRDPDGILDERSYAAARLSERLTGLLEHWFATFDPATVEEWGSDHPLYLLVDEVEVAPPVRRSERLAQRRLLLPRPRRQRGLPPRLPVLLRRGGRLAPRRRRSPPALGRS